MAHLDLAALSGLPIRNVRISAPRIRGMSGLELAVIAAASHDSLGSLKPKGKWQRRLARLVSFKDASPPLADPNLEAFRHTAVHAWHGHARLPEPESAAPAAAGYSEEVYGALQVTIARARRCDAAGQ